MFSLVAAIQPTCFNQFCSILLHCLSNNVRQEMKELAKVQEVVELCIKPIGYCRGTGSSNAPLVCILHACDFFHSLNIGKTPAPLMESPYPLTKYVSCWFLKHASWSSLRSAQCAAEFVISRRTSGELSLPLSRDVHIASTREDGKVSQ